MKFFGEISKVQDEDDGTIKVYGIASTGSVDSDGEVITPDAMKAAIPGYMKWGAVRSMHQPIAAGTAIEAHVNEKGEFEFGAHIVDAEAVKKVKTGVYKGFSVGGKATARDPLKKSVITAMNLIEVSLVDRPANQDAVINLWKAEAAMSTEPQEAQAPAVEPTVIKKGLYSVASFAGLLSSLGSLASDLTWEAEYEADNSPVPQQFKDWIAQGAELLTAMTHEELDEFLGAMTKKAAGVTKAADADDIQKAGAKFSKSARAALAEIHKTLKGCDEAMSKLGYDAEDAKAAAEEEASDAKPNEDEASSEAKKSAEAEDIAKAAAIADEAIAKALAPVNAALDLAKADLAKANARVAELEAMPAPAKAVLHVVEKSASVTKDDIDPVMKSDGSIDDAATAIKKAMSAASFRIGA